MIRNIILAVVVASASLAVTPIAEAKKGGGGTWKGPPPHGNAWGYYKKFGWPDYWYGGYPYNYAPPPAYYGWPAPVYSYPPPYAPAVPPPAPELLPPPLPAPPY